MSRTYDFSLAAAVGDSRLIQAQGTRLKVLSASGGSVIVRTDAGAVYELLEGQGFTLETGKAFREVYVSNPRASVNRGDVFIGDATFNDDRVTGNVAIIDNSAAKTSEGRQFMQSAAASSAGMNVVSVMANGGSVAVRKIMISSATAGEMLIGTCTGPGTATPGGSPMANKLAGGPPATAVLTSGSCATGVPSGAEIPGYSQFLRIQVPANQPVWMDSCQAPWVINGTRGLCLLGGTLGRDLTVAFDVEEL